MAGLLSRLEYLLFSCFMFSGFSEGNQGSDANTSHPRKHRFSPLLPRRATRLSTTSTVPTRAALRLPIIPTVPPRPQHRSHRHLPQRLWNRYTAACSPNLYASPHIPSFPWIIHCLPLPTSLSPLTRCRFLDLATHFRQRGVVFLALAHEVCTGSLLCRADTGSLVALGMLES